MLSVRARPSLAVATLKQREAPELHRSKKKILPHQESVQGAWPQAFRVVLSTVAACCLVYSSPIGWQLEARAGPQLSQGKQEIVEIAGLFGLGGEEADDEDRDTDPFTLQGSTEKQYSIDELQGSKIVRRRPGVTTKTCIKIASTAQAGGSGSVEAPEKSLCRAAEDRLDIKKACQSSCRMACADSLEEYRTSIGRELGFPPSKQSLVRPGRSCARSCSYECQKEGSGYKFTVNSNR